jgi:hypothetical protein
VNVTISERSARDTCLLANVALEEVLIIRATLVAVTAVVLSVAGAVLDVIDLNATHTFGALGFVAFPVVGLAVARSQPRNTVAWTFLVSGLLNGINSFGQGFAAVGQRDGWPAWLQFFGAWCTGWSWFPGLFLIITIGLLHFPNGKPVSPRWRWADKAAIATMCLWIVAVGVATWGLPADELDSSSAPHPHGWRAVIWTFAYVCFLAILPLIVTAVSSLIVRWRRSGLVQKTQIRWVVAAGALAVIAEITIDALPELGVPVSDAAQTLTESASFGLIAVATGFAILRYRLYDIDRIISRSLSYVAVTGLLVGVYATVVVVTTDVLSFSSPVAGTASTLAAAALFSPVRRRVQRIVNRRFNRTSYNADATLAQFSARLRESVDLASVRADLLDTVSRSVEPSQASIWIKPTLR